jgi:hypothetical protein
VAILKALTARRASGPDCGVRVNIKTNRRAFWSISQARTEAQVSDETLRNWCRRYGIGRKIGGRYRINPSALRAMLDPAPDRGADASAAAA